MKDYAPLTTTELIAVGNALYGDTWQSNLAKSLTVDSRRIRQWLKHERPIPAGVTKDVIQLLEANSDTTLSLAKKLKEEK